MQQFLTIIHILAAVFLIVLVLMQKGKGSDMGAGFGGASQTIFGSQGTTPFLVKLTGSLAFVFFITCGALSFFISTKHTPMHDIIETIPLAQQPIKKEPMIPTAEQPKAQELPVKKAGSIVSVTQMPVKQSEETAQQPDALSMHQAHVQPPVMEVAQESIETADAVAPK